MTDSILVFSLGPVQGFIAESRRTADGWVGSYLLSYLTGRAVLALERRRAAGEAIELLEPDTASPMYRAIAGQVLGPGSDPTIAALPNTIVARVPDGTAPEAIGAAIAAAIDEAWREIAADTWAILPAAMRNAAGVEQTWSAQLARHWEKYWAWGESPTRAYQRLAGRKALRDFTPWDEEGDRCTVCGQRAPLIDGALLVSGPTVQDAARQSWGARNDEPRNARNREWALLLLAGLPSDRPSTLIRTDGRERLCAVCLVKRLVPWIDNPIRRLWKSVTDRQPAAFPSTATMCTVLYRCELLRAASRDDDLKSVMKGYVRTLREELERVAAVQPRPDLVEPRMTASTFEEWSTCQADLRKESLDADLVNSIALDGDFYLYGESVARERGLADTNQHARVRQAYQAVQAAAHAAGVGDPPIYWALLTMDGDHLGAYLNHIERIRSEAPDDGADTLSTRAVSTVLAEFANNAPRIVAEHNGRTIFAGGDDVLAMFPLKTALRAAEALRLDFTRRFDAWLQSVPDGPARAGIGSSPTLSGSIIFAHHQAPLARVIRQGHDVLKHWAKLTAGRNALAVQRFMRGGPSETFAARWGEPGSGLVAKLEETMALLTGATSSGETPRTRSVANRFMYNLREFAWMLGPSIEKDLGTEPLFDSEKHRRSFLASLMRKSRLAEISEDTDGIPESGTAVDEDRTGQIMSRVRQLLDFCDGAAAGDMTAADRLALEPLILARFLAGEGREDR